MTENKYGAIALLIGTVLMLAVAFYHPRHSVAHMTHNGAVASTREGREPHGHTSPAPRRGALRPGFSAVVHSAALLALCVLTFGYFCAVRGLGAGAPLLWFSFTCFAFSSFASMCAATMSGFVTGAAAFAAMSSGAPDASIQLITQVPVWINQAFGFQHVAFASIAALVWGFSGPGRGAWNALGQFAGALAGVLGLAVLAVVLSDGARLETTHFSIFTVVQAIWASWIAASMWARKESGL